MSKQVKISGGVSVDANDASLAVRDIGIVQVEAGDFVMLNDEEDSIVPAGTYRVSHVNPNGSFHVGGLTAVWPKRIAR